MGRHMSNSKRRALRRRRLESLRRHHTFEPRRLELQGEVYVTTPLPSPSDGVTTAIPAIEQQFIYRPPFLLSIDADYMMKQIKPRIAIREGWRFVY
jgi:hypothetical protein